jgi:PIN domain nuclease of toxin-antitoxin system
MKLLLDTHALVWWVQQHPNLSTTASAAISDPAAVLHVSIGTVWEISIKVGLGKWPEAAPVLANFEAILLDEKIALLPITIADARAAGLTQSPHRDPFDRLLAAQALQHGLTLVSRDNKLRSLGAPVIW